MGTEIGGMSIFRNTGAKNRLPFATGYLLYSWLFGCSSKRVCDSASIPRRHSAFP